MAVSSTEADLVLIGGKIRTPAHPSGFVQALAVRDGVIAAVGTDDDIRELAGRRTRVIDLRGRLALPAFGDAHVHPVSGGLESLRCNLLGLRTRHECLDTVADYQLGPAPRRLGARRRLDHVGLPRRLADGRRPGRRHRRTARLPAQPGSPQRLGEHGGPDSARASTPAPPTRSTAGSSGTNPARRRARCTTGPCAWSPTACRRRRRPSSSPDSWRARRTCTRWASPASRTPASARRASSACRTRSTPISWRPTTACSAATWSAPCGGTAHRGLGPDRRPAGAARAGQRRPVQRGQFSAGQFSAGQFSAGQFRATTVKLMLDGVCETFTAAMSSPYLDRHGHATGHQGRLFIEPEMLREATQRLGRGRIPAALPRHRRSRRQHRARRDRGAPGRAAPGRAPPPGAPAVHHPAGHGQVRRARRGGQLPAAVGRARKRRWKS